MNNEINLDEQAYQSHRTGDLVDIEKPIICFEVITDIHITTDNEHVHNKNFQLALKDIMEQSPASRGIMIVGDITDHGFPEEYEKYNAIVEEQGKQLAPIYMTMGNHDVGLGIWEDRIQRFLAETNAVAIYHNHWIEDYQFIFLGTESNHPLFCTMTQQQLTWLEAQLEKSATLHKPAFVFLHQPLKNTTAGSFEEQEWYGVEEDNELREVLSKYPNALMFTGHTHWELEARHPFLNGLEQTPPIASMLNAASVAYLWTDEDEHKDGSQGFYVEVYYNKVVVKGRDFTTNSWIESARYNIEYSHS